MGKGTIISEYGAGKYLVSINYDRERLDALLASIDAQIASIDIDIAELALAEDAARAALATAGTDLDIAIIFYTSDPSKTNKRAVEIATTRKNSAIDALDDALAATATAELRKVALEKRDVYLRNAIPDSDPEVDVWCADLNEGLAGEVGVIDPGRIVGDKTPIITPAGADGDLAAYDSTRDGVMLSPAVMSPAAAFYNQAMLAGTNKWKPQYRKGVITATDGDTCTVSFAAYPLSSTSQNINVNQATTVEAGFSYMNCNGMAFESGDHVVVAFEGCDWQNPVVIGFVSNPKPCDFHGFLLSANGTNYNIVDGAGWSARSTIEIKYGGIDWRGPDGDVVTWEGNSRYNLNEGALGRNIYRHGKVIKTIDSGAILGAAIAGNKLFYVVTYPQEGGLLPDGSYAFTNKEHYFFADLDNLENQRLALEKIWEGFDAGHTLHTTPWLISEDGTEGTTTKNLRQTPTDGAIQARCRLSIGYGTELVTITTHGNTWSARDIRTEVATSPGGLTSYNATCERLRTNTAVFLLEDYRGDTLVHGEIEDSEWSTQNISQSASLWGEYGYAYAEDITESGTFWWHHTYKISVEGIILEEIVLRSHKRTSTLSNLKRTTIIDAVDNYSRVAWIKHLDIRSKTLIYEARKQSLSTARPWQFWSVATVPAHGDYDDLLDELEHGTVKFEWENIVAHGGEKTKSHGLLSSGHSLLWRVDYYRMLSPPLRPAEDIYHYCLRTCPIDVGGTTETAYGEHSMTDAPGDVRDLSGVVNVNTHDESIDYSDGGWLGPKEVYLYGTSRYESEFKWQLEVGHSAVFWEESPDTAWYPGDLTKLLVSTREGYWSRTPSADCLTPGLGDLLTWAGAGEPYTALITDGNIDGLVADSPRFNIGVS